MPPAQEVGALTKSAAEAIATTVASDVTITATTVDLTLTQDGAMYQIWRY